MFGKVLYIEMCRECAVHNDGRGFKATDWPTFPGSAMKPVEARYLGAQK